MSISIKYNDQKHLATDMIRRFDLMTDKERTRMSENLGIDASNFQTRIVLATGKDKKARDSIDEFARQVPLVEMAPGRWVIAKNIVGVETLPKKRTQQMEENGNALNHEFKSAVETLAGIVWSTATPEEVFQRKATALRQNASR